MTWFEADLEPELAFLLDRIARAYGRMGKAKRKRFVALMYSKLEAAYRDLV